MLARTRGGSAQGRKCQAPTLICGRSRPGASGSPTISLARSGAQTWIELLGGHGSPGRLVPATWPPGGLPTPRGSSQKNQLAFLRGAPRAHRQGMGHRTSPKFGQHALPLGTVVESEPSRPTPLSSGVRFLCKSERNSSFPGGLPWSPRPRPLLLALAGAPGSLPFSSGRGAMCSFQPSATDTISSSRTRCAHRPMPGLGTAAPENALCRACGRTS